MVQIGSALAFSLGQWVRMPMRLPGNSGMAGLRGRCGAGR
jgi:hypothetical protein